MNFVSYANVLKIIDFWNQNALKIYKIYWK